MRPAIALLEFESIARGIEAGDAMIKRAPLEAIRAGTVHPGRYLVLVGGRTADVEEAVRAGREIAGAALVDVVFLPDVHPDVVSAIGGARRQDAGEALGVIETVTVAALIDAADAGVKGARVTVRELRLADDLGGKGYVLFGGTLAEVEAAVEQGAARAEATGRGVTRAVISQLHEEMQANLASDPRFAERVRGAEKPPPDAGPVAPPSRGGRPLPGSGGGRGRQPAAPAAAPAEAPPAVGRQSRGARRGRR